MPVGHEPDPVLRERAPKFRRRRYELEPVPVEMRETGLALGGEDEQAARAEHADERVEQRDARP